jgi:hypothetical protein
MPTIYRFTASNTDHVYTSRDAAIAKAIESWRSSPIQCRADISIHEIDELDDAHSVRVARITSDLRTGAVSVADTRPVPRAAKTTVPGTLAHARRAAVV